MNTSIAMEQGLEKPLAGVRVLEFSYSRPARIAGQLLADFGADVVRAVSTGAERPEIREPGDVSWDRGKRLVDVDESEIASLVEGADIFIVDRAPSKLAELGIREQDLDPKRRGIVYVWLPPYGPRGEWAELAEDPLLLAAVGGVACQYPGTRPGIPVAPVVSNITQVHGALGAAAALAGLQGLEANGYGYGVTGSGLQASTAVLTAMTLDTLDAPMVRPSRHRRGPNWRFYQGSDGRWFFLATLTPDLLLRALTVIGRADVLAFLEIDGDFYKVLGDEAAGRVVNAALEAHFAAEPTQHWLDLFAENNVAAAAIQTRQEWTEGEIIAANGGFVTRIDEELGEVSMPGVPVHYEKRRTHAGPDVPENTGRVCARHPVRRGRPRATAAGRRHYAADDALRRGRIMVAQRDSALRAHGLAALAVWHHRFALRGCEQMVGLATRRSCHQHQLCRHRPCRDERIHDKHYLRARTHRYSSNAQPRV
ncbi:hypothetical protein GCM10022383_26020 [Microbacterium soli]|uniref:Uncharacterized protein n=1 Tax=Microbacterium soli TaxID=446075 RepID=A0ABP7NJD6_9MICO